jgi:hypothetical protein
MPLKSCRVTMRDMDGIEHTTTVTAESLFEAVARGMMSIRRQDWVDGLTLQSGKVTVEVGEAPVQHHVDLSEFNKWIERPGRSPRDIIQKGKVRDILGKPA